MTSPSAGLFIERRFIPNDGTRRVIADGHVKRQGDAGACQADDALLADLGQAMPPVPGEHLAVEAGREAWSRHQQRGGAR